MKTPSLFASFWIWMTIFMSSTLAVCYYGMAGLLASFMFWIVVLFVVVVILNKIE